MSQRKLKELQKIWYKKLKDEGFKDIELDNNFNIMENYTADNFNYLKKKYSKELNKIDYYRFAGQFYWDHEFKNDIEKEIWRLHTEGVSIDNIYKTLSIGRRRTFVILKRLKYKYFFEYIKTYKE